MIITTAITMTEPSPGMAHPAVMDSTDPRTATSTGSTIDNLLPTSTSTHHPPTHAETIPPTAMTATTTATATMRPATSTALNGTSTDNLAAEMQQRLNVAHDEIPSLLSMTDALASPSDLEMDLTDDDADLVHKFEDGWRDFLKENPDMIPKGKRGYQLERLNKDVQELIGSKEAAVKELQNQLNFFNSSREHLESVYQHETSMAAQRQTQVQDRIAHQLDTITIAEEIMYETLPWQNFLECVDSAATHMQSMRSGREKAFKPSSRAMALVDRKGEDEDIRLRAYRIDHAILTAQVKMLAREVERYEKSNESLDTVAAFLTEHNIWGILSKQQQQSEEKDAPAPTTSEAPSSPVKSYKLEP